MRTSAFALDRRKFFGLAAGTASLLGVPSWLSAASRMAAKGERTRSLVVVSLDGGNDGLATFVPREDDRYFRARPTIAPSGASLRALDSSTAAHRSLEHVARRFAEGQVSIVRGVGSPVSNLSHFASRDVWESGSLESPLPSTGWLGRTIAVSAGDRPLPAVAVGADAMPYALRESSGRACVVPSLEEFRVVQAPEGASRDVRRARARAIEQLYAGGAGPLLQDLGRAYRTARLSARALERVERTTNRVPYPPSELGERLSLVARVVASELETRVFHVAQPGYDTHTDHVGSQLRLLGQLDSALDAFMRDLAAHDRLDQVLILVTSEFGRRVKESGVGEHAGTDHGDANSLFLMGTGVRAGMYGEAPDLENLDENGNWRTRIDFRRLYADVLRDWLGVSPEPVLGRDFASLGTVTPT